MEDFDNGMVWKPLLSLLEDYAGAVNLPHVDLQTDYVRRRGVTASTLCSF